MELSLSQEAFGQIQEAKEKAEEKVKKSLKIFDMSVFTLFGLVGR